MAFEFLEPWDDDGQRIMESKSGFVMLFRYQGWFLQVFEVIDKIGCSGLNLECEMPRGFWEGLPRFFEVRGACYGMCAGSNVHRARCKLATGGGCLS